VSIAAHDYLLTLPSEYRLYKSSDQRRLGMILFILIRYSSVILMVVSNVGFFYHHFSPKSCGHYHYVCSIFKVIQMMVSQAILGIRTYSISLHNVWVGRTILLTYFITVGFQWFSNLVHLIPVMTNGNCVAASSRSELPVSTWSFYLAAMLFDCLTLSISTVYLLNMRVTGASSASRLVNILLYDGLGYIIALTAVNMMNVFLHRDTRHSIQSSGVSLGYAVTWIMSQRILIHPQDARAEKTSVVIPQLPTQIVMPHDMHFSGVTRGERSVNRARSPGSRNDFVNTQSYCALQVRIERSIVVDIKQKDSDSTERRILASPKSVQDHGHTV